MTDSPARAPRVDASSLALIFLGFSLYKTLMLDSYLGNFGTADGSLGYVSNIPFMAGASAGIFIASGAIFLLRGRGMLRPLPFRLPLALLLLGYLYGMLAPISAIDIPSPILGATWGLSTTFLTICYAELISKAPSPTIMILQLALATFASALLVLVIDRIAKPADSVACAAMAALCALSIHRCRSSLSEAGGAPHGGSALKRALRDASLPIVAYVFFEMVVGLVNMFAFTGGSSFVIASSAPMWGMLVCAGLLVAFVVVSNKTPNPEFVHLVVYPVAIGVFLSLPFLGETTGPQASVLIYAAYIFASTFSMFCYITACVKHEADVCQMGAIVHFAARTTLTIGLALGYGLARLETTEPFLKTCVVVAICSYLLLLVVIYWGFHASRHKPREVVVQTVTESFEDASKDRIESLGDRYQLTHRERDVYLSLVKGGTAKSIAEQLGLSPYTVQGHIQNLYGKLGVNKKDQAVELFYKQDQTPEKLERP